MLELDYLFERITAPNILNHEISTKILTKSMDPVWKQTCSQDIIRNQSQFNPVQLNSINKQLPGPLCFWCHHCCCCDEPEKEEAECRLWL